MNQIATINQPSVLTMSSIEIARLTEKPHDNVIRDIKAMLTDLSFEASDFAGTYIDPTGRKLPCFNLPKRETTILVSGYSVVLRARIVDRWMELEEQVRSTPVVPALPTNYFEALKALVASEEAKLLAETGAKELDGLSANSRPHRHHQEQHRRLQQPRRGRVLRQVAQARPSGHYRPDQDASFMWVQFWADIR